MGIAVNTLEVLAPGMLTTVQDLGREGFGPLGISPSGAADALSLRIGNLLAGNPQGAAALEMTLLGGTFRFPDGCVFSLAGSDFGATLDAAPAKLWQSVRAQPGQILQLGPTRSGARCYLCVRGGIQVEKFLGSASTHLLSGVGGFEGRALRKGDVLRIESAGADSIDALFAPKTLPPALLEHVSPRKTLRVTAGPQSEWFLELSRRAFYENAYRLTEESDRLGIRLAGAPVPCPRGGDMITEGVSLGAIQVPPDGQPIIVFVEQQTTGGYPKIANVISADLHTVGQLRPRDEIRFELVSMETAHSLLHEQEQIVTSLEPSRP
jgi:antagonist of KipI